MESLMTSKDRDLKIGVYGICKNEKDFIRRCYESIREADAIVICDTGSTDGTIEVLNELAQSHKCMLISKINVIPWRFDDARNCALFSLPADIDVCISIDADELIEPGWYELLKSEIQKDLDEKGKVSDRYHHRFKTIWDWNGEGRNISEHWHERIHSRHGYRWNLPVHEVLIKCDGTPETVHWIKDLTMIQKPDTTKSRSSYLPLLEQSAKEDKKRWKTFSFLSGEYIAAGRYPEAIKALEHALSLNDSDKAFIHYQISGIYQRMGDHDEAISHLMTTCKLSPKVREFVVYLAHAYIAAGRKTDAIAALDRAAKITERTYGYEYNANCWGEPFDNLRKQVAA
jgi:glycosyltransferase involved in cell wall biosynthesis